MRMSEAERFISFMRQYELRRALEDDGQLVSMSSLARRVVHKPKAAEVSAARSVTSSRFSYLRKTLPGGCVLYRLIQPVARTGDGAA